MVNRPECDLREPIVTHPSYQQTSKQIVRERALGHAVRALSSERDSAPIVLLPELFATIEVALKTLGDKDVARQTVEEIESWSQTYTTKIGKREPSELSVLYLCGPEPLNDLKVLVEYGVNPDNVWAVESQGAEFAKAAAQLGSPPFSVKIHRGDLAQFFDSYDERFDIVYYDSCSPLLSRKPNALDPILKLLANGRLSPLAVLVTNFAEIPSEHHDAYCGVLSSYFRFRYRDVPQALWASGLDPAECEVADEELRVVIAQAPEPFYSDFITRFLVDLARYWIPNCRALAHRAVADLYLADKRTRDDSLDAAQFIPPGKPNTLEELNEWIRETGDIVLSPGSYPLDSFLRSLKAANPSDPLISQLGNLKICGQEAGRLIGYASIMDKVLEGHWNCLSQPMLRAIAWSWFDRQHPFSCDAPLPNLLVNSLLGIYGRPAFPNVRRSCRLTYRAKQTQMFTDVLLLDQCRYYFDWLPTVEQAPKRFESRGCQVLARCILDLKKRQRVN